MSKKNKRKWEFKKWLAFWCMLLIMVAVGLSFYLAYTDHQTVSDVTTTIITACIAYLVSYAAASTTEKVSRNRHGLDADGIPFNINNVAPTVNNNVSVKEEIPVNTVDPSIEDTIVEATDEEGGVG